MTKGTTPTITYKIPKKISVDEIQKASIVFNQGSTTIIEKSLEDCEINKDNNSLNVRFSQEETFLFDSHYPILTQIRFKYKDEIIASNINKIAIYEILKEVIL